MQTTFHLLNEKQEHQNLRNSDLYTQAQVEEPILRGVADLGGEMGKHTII